MYAYSCPFNQSFCQSNRIGSRELIEHWGGSSSEEWDLDISWCIDSSNNETLKRRDDIVLLHNKI